MELTAEEMAILAHVVVDPDAWINHSINVFGEETARKHLAEKIARHEADYLAQKDLPGYKTRAQRVAAG